MTVADICKKLVRMMNMVRVPAKTIPAALINCGAIMRPGLSPTVIASNIVRRMPEAGAENSEFSKVAEAMERVRVEEIVNAIKSDMKIEVGLAPGSIQFTGVGANGGGPVEVTGFNINAVHGDGIAQ